MTKSNIKKNIKLVANDIILGLMNLDIYDELEEITDMFEEDPLGAWSCNQDNDEQRVMFSLTYKKTKQKFNITVEEDRI